MLQFIKKRDLASITHRLSGDALYAFFANMAFCSIEPVPFIFESNLTLCDFETGIFEAMQEAVGVCPLLVAPFIGFLLLPVLRRRTADAFGGGGTAEAYKEYVCAAECHMEYNSVAKRIPVPDGIWRDSSAGLSLTFLFNVLIRLSEPDGLEEMLNKGLRLVDSAECFFESQTAGFEHWDLQLKYYLQSLHGRGDLKDPQLRKTLMLVGKFLRIMLLNPSCDSNMEKVYFHFSKCMCAYLGNRIEKLFSKNRIFCSVQCAPP